MVAYYFESKERQEKLYQILEEWLNTPFRHKCGVKGLGTDCVHFGIRVLEEFQLIDLMAVVLPDYPRDWHLHNTREALREAILRYLNVVEIRKTDPMMNGDITLAHYGKASSHVGIYYDARVYQAITNIGVKKIAFEDKKFYKQIKYVYRIIEK